MRIIKSADARNVIPFPARHVEPLLLDRLVENNRRQIEESQMHRRRIVRWVRITGAIALAAVGLTWLCWWMAGR